MKKVLIFLCVAIIVAAVVLVVAKIAIPYNAWWLGAVGDFLGIESTVARWVVTVLIDIVVTIGVIFVVGVMYSKFSKKGNGK